MAFKLRRRTFLRGTGGIAIALPVLECMLNNNGDAMADVDDDMPTRFAVVFAGQSLGGDGYARNESRIAGQTIDEGGHHISDSPYGALTATTPLLDLEAADLLGDISLVSNLNIPWNQSGGAVPDAGAFREFHGGGTSPLLCGVKSESSSHTANGITGDQVLAQMVAASGAVTFDSLVYRAQPSWYLSGSSYSGRQYISYTGPNEGVDAQTSPQIAFMSLFSNFTPDNEEDIAILDFNLRARRSVLDLVLAKRQEIEGKLGASDRVRLEKHYDELRDLEMRISAIDPTGGDCQVPADPGTDPPIGGDNAGSGGGDIQENTGYSDEQTRGDVFVDMMHMAFTCDLARVATLQLTVMQSHMNMFQPTSSLNTPVLADLHEVGHNGDPDDRGQIASSTCLRWHVSFYSRLVQKMKETTEGAGTMLDNSALIFMTEGGHGRQLDDGVSENQTHCVEGFAQMVAGRAGGLNPGRHIDAGGAHPIQVTISAMQAVGYEGDSLGEVTGTVDELFA